MALEQADKRTLGWRAGPCWPYLVGLFTTPPHHHTTFELLVLLLLHNTLHRSQLRQQRPQSLHPVSPHRSSSVTGARHTARLALRRAGLGWAGLGWLLASRSAAIAGRPVLSIASQSCKLRRSRGRRISGTSTQPTTIVIPHARPCTRGYSRVPTALASTADCLTFTHTLSLPPTGLVTLSLTHSLYNPRAYNLG